jgi:ribosomal protein S18 acetylase RimI-like enzyme
MPVSLEIINRPDATDLGDLEKIYADYPLPPVASFEQWLDSQREEGAMLIAGRFNGRLLGALWVADDGRIEHLCVRAVTRRRGTARQLLQLLQSHAAQLQLAQLYVAEAEELATLWGQLGFERQGAVWMWPR